MNGRPLPWRYSSNYCRSRRNNQALLSKVYRIDFGKAQKEISKTNTVFEFFVKDWGCEFYKKCHYEGAQIYFMDALCKNKHILWRNTFFKMPDVDQNKNSS